MRADTHRRRFAQIHGNDGRTSSSFDDAEAPLAELAAAHGIAADYVDASGVRRRIAAATLRSLLASLGIAAGDEASVARQLTLARAGEAEPFGPVTVVLGDGEAVAVELSLPAGTGEIAWRLTLEAGGERAGRCAFGSLALVADGAPAGRERRRLILGAALPLGYHQLALGEPAEARTMVIVSPGRCYVPGDARAPRLFGVAAQLYLLRSEGNWGIGDFGDLRAFVRICADHGVDVIGLNPLHAMFLDDPELASPYSPESRLFLNVLNIDVEAVAGYAESGAVQRLVRSETFAGALAAVRSAPLVAYAAVANLKHAALRALFDDDRDRATAAPAFERFRSERGLALRRLAIFEALRERFGRDDAARRDWHTWPAAYRDPASAEVAAFEREHATDVTFFAWLQWIADEQLAAAAAAARSMRVGLYRDLAVGADPNGAELWSNPTAIVPGVHVGAPPDIHNVAGQDWGLPPFDPRALRAERYASFIDLVRANMRHAGAIRIDHVMALQRLYVIPAGGAPPEGAYLAFPLDDLVGILALESVRHRCIVVGEDLGTVPAGFRERMARANILSYRVLYFEMDPGNTAFLPPPAYPSLALAVVGSHDLATLGAWWTGADLKLRERIGLIPEPAERERLAAERTRARAALHAALIAAGALPPGGREADLDQDTLGAAVARFLARTPALLAMAQLDDISGEIDPVNVPATTVEYPNWRRRSSVSLEALATHAGFRSVMAAMRDERAASPMRLA